MARDPVATDTSLTLFRKRGAYRYERGLRVLCDGISVRCLSEIGFSDGGASA